MQGESEDGDILGRFRFTGIARPRFAERARYFGLEKRLAELFAATELNERQLGAGWRDD
jgi:pilus assembly protein CpaF